MRPHPRLPCRARRALLCVPFLFPTAGCLRRVSYESPDGRRVEVLNVGFDTKIGRLRAVTPDGEIEVEAAESQAAVAVGLLRVAAGLAEGGRP